MRKPITAAVCVAMVLAACGDDNDDDATTTEAASETTTADTETTEAPADTEAPDETDAAEPATTDSEPADLSGDPVIIGAIGAQSGALAGGSSAEPIVGAEAAAAYINEELGGFGGRPVEVVTCDTESTPAGALTCANRLVAEDVMIVTGLSVNWAQNGLNVVSEAGIINQTLPVSPQEVSDANSFPLGGGVFSEYPAQSAYAIENLDAQRGVAAFADIPALNDLSISLFGGPYEAAGLEFTPVLVPAASADISPSLATVLDADPDFLSVALTAPQTVQMYQSLFAQDFDMSRVINFSGTANHETFFDVFPEPAALEGTLYSTQFASYDDLDDPEVAIYRHAMETYGGVEGRGSFYQSGFSTVMTAYKIASDVGFESFDAAALKSAYESEVVPIFLGFEYDRSTAPEDLPNLGASFVRILQYSDGDLINLSDQFIDGVTGEEVTPGPSQYDFLPAPAG